MTNYDFERPNFLIGTYFNLMILQVTYFLSSLVLAYAVGFMIAVVVELPCANLEALVWRKWEKKNLLSTASLVLQSQYLVLSRSNLNAINNERQFVIYT